MNKLTNRLIIIIVSVALFGMSAFVLLHSEEEKRQFKVAALESDYFQQYKSWEEYKKAFDDQVAKLKEENAKKMVETKVQYESLLAQQPTAIKQHSRVVAQNSSTSFANSSTGGTTVSNTSTGTKTVKVSRPASKPKTSSS